MAVAQELLLERKAQTPATLEDLRVLNRTLEVMNVVGHNFGKIEKKVLDIHLAKEKVHFEKLAELYTGKSHEVTVGCVNQSRRVINNTILKHIGLAILKNHQTDSESYSFYRTRPLNLAEIKDFYKSLGVLPEDEIEALRTTLEEKDFEEGLVVRVNERETRFKKGDDISRIGLRVFLMGNPQNPLSTHTCCRLIYPNAEDVAKKYDDLACLRFNLKDHCRDLGIRLMSTPKPGMAKHYAVNSSEKTDRPLNPLPIPETPKPPLTMFEIVNPGYVKVGDKAICFDTYEASDLAKAATSEEEMIIKSNSMARLIKKHNLLAENLPLFVKYINLKLEKYQSDFRMRLRYEGKNIECFLEKKENEKIIQLRTEQEEPETYGGERQILAQEGLAHVFALFEEQTSGGQYLSFPTPLSLLESISSKEELDKMNTEEKEAKAKQTIEDFPRVFADLQRKSSDGKNFSWSEQEIIRSFGSIRERFGITAVSALRVIFEHYKIKTLAGKTA